MQMKEIYAGEHFKVKEVILSSGQVMPEHRATSDAFVIVKKGKGKLVFSDSENELTPGSSILIPANKIHRLEITEDFNAFVVFEKDGEIEFL